MPVYTKTGFGARDMPVYIKTGFGAWGMAVYTKTGFGARGMPENGATTTKNKQRHLKLTKKYFSYLFLSIIAFSSALGHFAPFRTILALIIR